MSATARWLLQLIGAASEVPFRDMPSTVFAAFEELSAQGLAVTAQRWVGPEGRQTFYHAAILTDRGAAEAKA